MKKTVIIYASTHLGNTKKIVDAIKAECDVDLIDATVEQEQSLDGYDLIGFASGIYAGKYHKRVIDFASVNLPLEKDVFFLFSSAMGRAKYDNSIRSSISNRNPNIVGSHSVRAMTTFGPFKLIGGAPKGRPNEKDLKKAVAFVKSLMKD